MRGRNKTRIGETTKERLIQIGYEGSPQGIEKLIKDNLSHKSTREIAHMIGLRQSAIHYWMRELEIKNPRGSGGNNNPGVRKGINKFKG